MAAAKAAAAKEPDTHDYSESETRDLYIDVLLKEAGWALDQPRDREYKVTGMPNDKGVGHVGRPARPKIGEFAAAIADSVWILQLQSPIVSDRSPGRYLENWAVGA